MDTASSISVNPDLNRVGILTFNDIGCFFYVMFHTLEYRMMHPFCFASMQGGCYEFMLDTVIGSIGRCHTMVGTTARPGTVAW